MHVSQPMNIGVCWQQDVGSLFLLSFWFVGSNLALVIVAVVSLKLSVHSFTFSVRYIIFVVAYMLIVVCCFSFAVAYMIIAVVCFTFLVRYF